MLHCSFLLYKKKRKLIPGRSKYGTEDRAAERMSKAKVQFYKEKGAAEMANLRRQGKDKIPDIELKFYPQRCFSMIDLEKKITTSLHIMSKCTMQF